MTKHDRKADIAMDEFLAQQTPEMQARIVAFLDKCKKENVRTEPGQDSPSLVLYNLETGRLIGEVAISTLSM